MRSRLGILAISVSLIFSSCASTPARGNDLPNSCAIIATEAQARLKTASVWCRVLFIRFFDLETRQLHGHALTVWQMNDGGTVFVYDEDGTIDLDTKSREVKDIAGALNRKYPAHPILTAKFVE